MTTESFKFVLVCLPPFWFVPTVKLPYLSDATMTDWFKLVFPPFELEFTTALIVE